MSEHTDVARLVSDLTRAHRRSGHRGLLHLAGSAAWTRQVAGLIRNCVSGRAVWIGSDPCAGFEHHAMRHAAQELGRDACLVAFNAHTGLDPDALGAIAGTVKGGGLLLLLTPAVNQWLHAPDTQQARIAIEGVRPDTLTQRYRRRFITLLDQASEVVRLEPGNPVRVGTPAAHGGVDWQPGTTADQHVAVAAIQRVARGRAHRPLVITADRGRGKSAALGMAAEELLRAGEYRILLTAPRRTAVDTVYRHAGDAGRNLRFIPPAELVEQVTEADLLLVDEAAGIPLSVLERLLRLYPRIVFASTVHGYEGTGRGFALRFRQVLDRLAPDWRGLELIAPIRWGAADPLEAVVNRLLLLDAATPAPPQTGEPEIRWLDRDRLATDEALLRQVFGLLVQAHYRTRPFDLFNLLDGPGLSLAVALSGHAVVGALLVSVEGGLDPALAEGIWLGLRRPHGHLLAQSLTAHVGVPRAATARMGRVMRIAVHPERQGEGVGTRLLEAFRAWAETEGLDLIGSSFGAEPSLLRFWYRNGYAPAHLGVRRDPASGAHAALVVQGLSDQGHGISLEALRAFRRGLPVWLRDYLRDLEPELLWPLLAPGGFVASPGDHCWDEGLAFAFAGRGVEASLAALHQLAWHGLPVLVGRGVAKAGYEPLLLRLLQGHDWQETSRRLGVSGRAQAVRALRAGVRELLLGTAPAQVRERAEAFAAR